MLVAESLCAGYGDIQVLYDVDIAVPSGQLVALVGANSAGKTSLIKAICGEIRVTSGSVIWQDQDITSLGPHAVAQLGIVQVPEGRHLFPLMSVEENLLVGSHSRRARAQRAENLARVYDLLPRLRDRRKQKAGSLSGGEQQMCAIGRGLMASPELLILDEPSIGLSPKITGELFGIIRQVHATGISVLLAEQNLLHALNLADTGIVIERGSVVMEAPAKELVGNEDVRRAYLGVGSDNK